MLVCVVLPLVTMLHGWVGDFLIAGQVSLMQRVVPEAGVAGRTSWWPFNCFLALIFVKPLFLFKTPCLGVAQALEEREFCEENSFLVKPYFCGTLTWGFLIFPDSVYVTALNGRERKVSKKMCSQVNPHFQEKMNFSLSTSPLPLSDAMKWWRPMKEAGTAP